MEKSSQQTESTHLNGDLSVAEGEEARSSGSSELRNADEGQEKQSPFYEGVVGQPLPNEGEVNNFEIQCSFTLSQGSANCNSTFLDSAVLMLLVMKLKALLSK